MLHDSRFERIDSTCDKIIAWNQHWRQLALNKLLGSLEILSNCAFRARTIVCDNHSWNVSSFTKLLEHINHNPDELYIIYFYTEKNPEKSRKIYLCYGAVHLTKNVRNSLLKCKRLYPLRLNFLDLKIQSMFLEGK